MTTETIRDLQISSSGSLAYWTIRPSLESDQYVSRLMVMERPSESPTLWTEIVGIAAGLLWKDATTLCYAVGKTLWEIRSPGSPACVCTLAAPIQEFSIVPGTSYYVCAVRSDMDTSPVVMTSLPIKQDGRGRLSTRSRLVWIGNGQPLKSWEADGDVWHPRVSPDGKRLAFLERPVGIHSLSDAHLYVTSLNDAHGGKIRVDLPRMVTDMAWASNGQELSILGMDGTIGIPRPLDLWIWREGVTSRVDMANRPWIGTSGGGDWAYPSRGATHWWWSEREVILSETIDGHVQLTGIDTRTGKTHVITSGLGNYTGATGIHGGNELFSIYEDSTALHEIVKISNGSESPVTAHNSIRFPSPEEYRVPTRNGDPVHTFVLPAEGRQRGTILSIHGGPHGAFSRSVHFLHNKLATAGFTIIYANPHGSIGYGVPFAESLTGQWGTLDERDWADILAHFEKLGRVDRQRLGVLGSSYGGFMATWLAGSWPFLRTAVIQAPVVDQTGMFWTSDIGYTFTAHGCAIEDYEPSSMIPRLWDNSPLNRASEIEASVLLLHGTDDDRCPISQSEALFTALKLAGKDVEWILYPAESHLMSTLGRPSTRIDRLNRICEWLVARYPIV
ncbi:MAG: alpha/beta hydrolase family protein [Sulfobacillus sp.]